MKKLIVLTGIVVFVLLLGLQGIILAQSSVTAGEKNSAALISHEKSENDNPLNLTAQQKEQIKALRDEEKARIRPLVSDLKAERQKLKVLRENNAKPDDINAQEAKIKFLKDKIQELRQSYETRIKNILTAEQRAKYEPRKKEFKKNRKEEKREHKKELKEKKKEKKEERKKEKDKEDNDENEQK